MTTIEHALLGANLVMATGLEKMFGWQAVALAGLCAVSPDWDGLTILWSVPLFDEAHRVWGHNLLVCSLVALLIAGIDYRRDFITRTARRFVHWLKLDVPKECLAVRNVFSWTGLAVWLSVGLLASWSHLAADAIFSGTDTLSDWELKLFWPFSEQGFVYPLIQWGDPGVTIIFVTGMFAMFHWKNRTDWIARLMLLVAAVYIILRNTAP